MTHTETLSTLDPAEVEKFSKLAAIWWDPKGKMGVLHKFNPVRIEWITEQVCARFGLDPLGAEPLRGLRFLDIGCGGGLLCEPMARLGATVMGVDPAEKNIRTAQVHAAEQGLVIDYRVGKAEDLAEAGEKFDVILNMEVIEHVGMPQFFVKSCCEMLKPSGLMFVATLNRTFKSFGLAIVGAEYILRWLPKGTHQWEKFIKPEELREWLSNNGVTVKAESGVVYHPIERVWRKARDMNVNYIVVGVRD